MVEKADVVYMSVPVLLILSAISWYGAHSVSIIVIGVMVLMVPALFYIVYAEKFDDYWIRRQETQPAQVGAFDLCPLRRKESHSSTYILQH